MSKENYKIFFGKYEKSKQEGLEKVIPVKGNPINVDFFDSGLKSVYKREGFSINVLDMNLDNTRLRYTLGDISFEATVYNSGKFSVEGDISEDFKKSLLDNCGFYFESFDPEKEAQERAIEQKRRLEAKLGLTSKLKNGELPKETPKEVNKRPESKYKEFFREESVDPARKPKTFWSRPPKTPEGW